MSIHRYILTTNNEKIDLCTIVSDTYKTYDIESMVQYGTNLMNYLSNDGDTLLFGDGTTKIVLNSKWSYSIDFSYKDESGQGHGYGLSGIVPKELYIGYVNVKGVPSFGAARLSNDKNGDFWDISNADFFNAWFSTVDRYEESVDPFQPGGSSGTGGGTGNFDGTGDDISIPNLPTLSAVDAGFITLFAPSISQMAELASYMWSDLFDINGWKKIFADPMDAILGLSIVPVAIPLGGAKTVKVGNISTSVSMPVALSQYVTVDCGTLNVNEYWGAYLDYDPFTKAEIYLPYVGIHPVSVDDIMNKSVHVVYHVDILSGACCAYVQCDNTVLYTFIGQCSCSIPITGDNWTNVVNGALSIAGSIGSMVATGGASAPYAVGDIASTAVNSMKPSVEKSGAMGGMGGMMGVQTPYIILTRPRQALPEHQNTFMGYPSFITMSLGNCLGYTEIESIHLENIPATEQELSEIENLLKEGVIL